MTAVMGITVLLLKSLQELIDSGKKIDFVLAIGPIPMMKAVAETTRPYGIKTVVSLKPCNGRWNRDVRRMQSNRR